MLSPLVVLSRLNGPRPCGSGTVVPGRPALPGLHIFSARASHRDPTFPHDPVATRAQVGLKMCNTTTAAHLHHPTTGHRPEEPQDDADPPTRASP